MRQSKTWFGALTALAAALASAPFACSDGNGVTTGDCAGAPDGVCPPPGGQGGAAGVGGAAGLGGTGGAPMMGSGGGGAGGAGGAACTDDASGDNACASGEGSGSLCVGGACTKAAGACSTKALVVVDYGRQVDDPALDGACHFRDLNGARAALTNATERLALYADEAASSGVLSFTAAATLDGHPGGAAPVKVTLPGTVGTALVRFGQGGALSGVELDGGGKATAVRVEAGALAVTGPTTLTNAALALELVGSAAATVTGAAATPVRLTDNLRGVVVPTDATVTMQGDGGEGLVVEGTSDGAGVLFDAATAAGGCSSLRQVTLRGNLRSSGGGTGAVEVRRLRRVVVDGCVFANNVQSVTFSGTGGAGVPTVDDFLSVHLMNNDFSAALPTTPPNSGAVLCGSNLGVSGTNLNLRIDNVFPIVPPADPPTQSCEQLPANSAEGCGFGQVFSHTGSSGMVRACQPGTCQCVGGSAQCVNP